MMDYYQGQKSAKGVKAVNTNVVLYLGELPPDLDQYELHQFIMSQGKFNIESLIVKPAGGNKSFAYVKFKSKNEVDRARKALHLKTLKDFVIRAEPFKQKDENTEKGQNAETNLFVKNLPSTTTPKDLYELFCKYGNIISIKLKQNDKGECIGYGYVNFEHIANAKAAIEHLNNCEFNGKELSVSLFTPKSKRTENQEYTFPLILIKQLPESIATEKDIQNIFQNFGQISFCGLIGGVNAESRIGVVVFTQKEEAESAVLNLNGKIIDDSTKPIILSIAPIDKEMLDKIWKAKQEAYKSKYEGCNLVVKSIHKSITDKNLFDIFKKFGEVASARIATEGKMKEMKNELGMIIDKEFVYESKGYGFVLFKRSQDAKQARDSLNNSPIEFQNMTIKFIVEFYDYSKAGGAKKPPGEMSFARPSGGRGKERKRNDNREGVRQYENRMSQQERENMENTAIVINNRTVIHPKEMGEGSKQRRNFNKHRDNPPFKQGNPYAMNMQMPMRGDVGPQTNQNPYMMSNQQIFNQPESLNTNTNTTNPTINTNKITVESYGLVNKIRQILQINSAEDRTEALGETIFYFLLQIIPQYNLNITNGRVNDTIICSKLTGILIKTDEMSLLEIVSRTDRLITALKDVINKLMQANKLGE